MQPDEFAPKLLGRDKKGRLLYGYASLPYVDYHPAMLSAAYPMYDKEGKALTLEVRNYGLSSSAPSQIVVEAGEKVGRGANRASRPLRHGGPASGFGFRADGKRIVRLDGHFLYRRERDRAEQIELLGGIEYHEDMVEMA